MQSLAMLDAILSPEWQCRYFSFNRRWSPGEQMGSMRDGQGDHYFALFNAAGCWLKGFDHESPMSPFASDPPTVANGVLDGVPSEFAECLREPAFVMDETTFCIWRRYVDRQWQRGPVVLPMDDSDIDGSRRLLRFLDGRPLTYRDWGEEYYECDVPLNMVEALYAHRPLDEKMVNALNGAVSLSQLSADVEEIGYPAP